MKCGDPTTERRFPTLGKAREGNNVTGDDRTWETFHPGGTEEIEDEVGLCRLCVVIARRQDTTRTELAEVGACLQPTVSLRSTLRHRDRVLCHGFGEGVRQLFSFHFC
jgi:hypothetical protein